MYFISLKTVYKVEQYWPPKQCNLLLFTFYQDHYSHINQLIILISRCFKTIYYMVHCMKPQNNITIYYLPLTRPLQSFIHMIKYSFCLLSRSLQPFKPVDFNAFPFCQDHSHNWLSIWLPNQTLKNRCPDVVQIFRHTIYVKYFMDIYRKKGADIYYI